MLNKLGNIELVIKAIKEVTDIRIENVNENLIHETGFDSLLVMTIIFQISDIFSISLYEEMSKIYNVEKQFTINNIVKTLDEYEKNTAI